MEEEWRKDGGLGRRKSFRTTPSRASENALLVHRVKVAIIIDLFAKKES